MALSPGTRLGPYEIREALGAGGMGEVYRARDTRLDRTVAIKVLAAHRVSDPQMRLRFEREARAVAGLSHPHICHLNDVGHHDGVDFLVMEHLEGETLAARLTRAAAAGGAGLPIDEMLRHAIEMAEALSEAHRHGIVHRDLKPGNVMLTKSGVKLLDFGLAKLQPMPGAPGASLSTLAATRENLSGEGSILGTWPYMAPEQVEGKEADTRSDMFAFGAVLYEMATGNRAFEGDSHASLIVAILEREPRPLSDGQPLAPLALERVVRKCLAKDPDARWQTARDLADALKWIAEERQSPRSSASGVAFADRPRSHRWPWVAAIVAALGLGATVASKLPRGEVAVAPVRRFVIHAPPDARIASSLALSTDGRALVYEANDGRGNHLYLRALDQLVARPIPGTEDGVEPAFSPDGQWIAYLTGSSLKKVSVTSGAAPITLSEFPDLIDQSIAWLPDNTIVLGKVSTGLFSVPGDGGAPVRITTPATEQGEIDHHNPRWLPGGKALLITRHRGPEAWDVAVLQLDTRKIRVIVPDAFDARYLPTGHLVFARGEALLAAPFDANRLEVSGPPVVMLDNVATAINNGAARYAVAEDGSLAYIPLTSRAGRRLAWIGPNGSIDQLPPGPRAYSRPSLSPDGTRVAVQIEDELRRDIWIYEIRSGTLTRLTYDGASESPVWTRNGRRLAFSTNKGGRREVYWQPVDGTAPPELLVTDPYSVFAGAWSADGRRLAFTREPPTEQMDIGLLDLETRRVTALVAGDHLKMLPRISPDGRWLAYSSNETGRQEVHVTVFPDGGAKRQISTDGGSAAVWSRDGRALFYRRGRDFLEVAVGGFPGSIGKPTIVASAARVPGGYFGHPGYDVAADGRLLIVQPAAEEAAPPRIEIVLNWFEELKQRVPVGK